jgi:RNA polymerase sigma factor (sigma-70 family)
MYYMTVSARIPSDSALWRRAAADDVDAFGLLFERHAKAIYNFCFRRTGDWATAEDLTSVVFLEAWRRRTYDVDEGKVCSWLYGIAVNVVRNRRRHLARYAEILRRLPAAQSEPDFADEAALRLDDERQMQALLTALAQLPRGQRDVLVLCGWLDVSYDDAAYALGIPVGTVRSRLARAREHFRRLAEEAHQRRIRVEPIKEAQHR